MESERIIRFLREELTESEKLEVLDWIEKSDENKSIFSELKNTMILADLFGKDKGRLSLNTGMACLLYTSPSPRDRTRSRMPSSA